MNEDWAVRMSRRLRDAARPTMAPAKAVVDDAARRAAQAARSGSLQVTSTDTRITVSGSGPAMAAARAEVHRRRPEIAAAVRQENARRLRG